MNTVNTILEPHPDGTLHLPLPEELRHGAVEVTATLRSVGESRAVENSRASGDSAAGQSTAPPLPRATPEMVRRRMEAFEALRAMGGLDDQIPDPSAWQREIRQDRPLPGRD